MTLNPNNRTTLNPKNNPCENCLTFAICKSQITPHLNQDNKSLLIDYIRVIDTKCPKITSYVQETRETLDTKLVPHICDTLREIFK